MHVKLARTKVLLAALVTIVAAAFAAGPAQADTVGPGYYLYHTLDPSRNANCTPNGLRGYIGRVTFDSPYSYKTVLTGSNQVGNIQHYFYLDDGFKTADKYHSCVNNDISFSFYGVAKVQRPFTVTFFCVSGGCSYGGVIYGAWKSKAWS